MFLQFTVLTTNLFLLILISTTILYIHFNFTIVMEFIETNADNEDEGG
jgi:hypothetical protein